MEQFFIQEKIYQKLEVAEVYVDMLKTVQHYLKPLETEINYSITKNDLENLLNIPIKRISHFDCKQSSKGLTKLENEIRSLQKSLRDMTRYTIRYLQKLQEKYGKAFPRRTEISDFDEIRMRDVVEEQKVGWDRKDGYLGAQVAGEGKHSLLCSPYDRLVLFYQDGSYQVIRVPEKRFVGKNLIQN